MAPEAEVASLNIQIQGTNEWVVVEPKFFPSNPYDLIYLLKVETAPRSAWLRAASIYHRLDNLLHCITVLETAVSDAVDAMLPKEALNRLDLLSALAGAHIMHAVSQTDLKLREKHLRAAADVFSRADTLNMDYPAIWASRGWSEFHAGKSLTSTWLDNAMENGLMLGAIGLAALYLNRPTKLDPKKDPVSLLVSALRAKCCPPGVWTALGYALYKEGRISLARTVAVRAISALRNALDHEKREAFYLLALVESASKKEDALNSMSIALAEAYHLNGQKDSRILSLIAHTFFSAGDFKRAESFAKRALDAVEEAPGASFGSMFGGLQASAKAEALFQLARAQHHLGRTDEAIFGLESVKTLSESDTAPLKVNPGVLLRLGLLKVAGERREDEQIAQECLERVLKTSGERCGIAKRALGVLLGRKLLVGLKRGRPLGGETFDKAVELLKHGLDDEPEGKKDVPAQLVYAALVEEFYPKKCLIAYRQAIATLEEQGEKIDPEIWNNFSSILARLGHVDEACEATAKIDDPYADSCPAVLYNRGRLAELRGRYDEAESIYRSFKPESSHYTEASIRLAVLLMRDKEGMKEAEELLQNAKDTRKSKACAVMYLSRLHEAKREFGKAQKVLEANRFDNDYLSLAFSSFMHRFLSALDEDRRSRFLTNHIGQPLVSLLKRNERNMAAANGVGVYFAEWKLYTEAREAFSNVGSGPKPDHDSRINLAHTNVLRGQRELRDSAKYTGRPSRRAINNASGSFEQAIKLYSEALEVSSLTGNNMKSFTSYCELLLYLGWAQFEARKFEQCIVTLKKLVHLMPTNGVAWFNLGHALFESATERVRTGTTRLKDLEIATREYEGSKMALNRSGHLLRGREDEFARATVSRADVANFERYVRQRAKKHDVNVLNAKTKAEDEAEQQRQRLADLKRDQEKEKQQREELEKERIKKEQQLREAFEASIRKKKQYEEQNLLIQEQRRKKQNEDEDSSYEEETSGAPQKRGKRKKKEEDFIVDDDAVDMEENPPKRRAVGRRRVADGSGSEYSDVPDDGVDETQVTNGSEENGESRTKRRRFNLQMDDDEEISDVGF